MNRKIYVYKIEDELPFLTVYDAVAQNSESVVVTRPSRIIGGRVISQANRLRYDEYNWRETEGEARQALKAELEKRVQYYEHRVEDLRLQISKVEVSS